MEALLSFIFASIMPLWIERVKKAAKKYISKRITGDEVVLAFCTLGAFGYILYVVLFEGIPHDATTFSAKVGFVFTALWTGAAGTYGLFYKHYFKTPDDQQQTEL